MALYTQKFIAADYLAKVQTQTHFFLRPLVGRAVWSRQREGRMNEEDWHEKVSEIGEKEGARRTRNSEEWREDTVSERAESFDDGCRSSSFPLILSLSPFCRLFAHAIRSSPRLNLAETGDFSAKTCTAFYCQIDHLNNSQHGNLSPVRSVVLSALFLLVPFSHFFFVSLYIISCVFNAIYLSRFFLLQIHDLCVYERK